METMNEISGYMSTGSDDRVNTSSGTSATNASSTGQVKNVVSSTYRSRNAPSKNDSSKMDVDDNHNSDLDVEHDNDDEVVPNIAHVKQATAKHSTVDLKRFDFIPLRLNEHERKLLQVLENALDVCEYTDVVDVAFSHTRKSKVSRIIDSLVDILSIASGLIVSNNLVKGEQILRNKSLNDNVPLFTEIFEIGRRYDER